MLAVIMKMQLRASRVKTLRVLGLIPESILEKNGALYLLEVTFKATRH